MAANLMASAAHQHLHLRYWHADRAASRARALAESSFASSIARGVGYSRSHPTMLLFLITGSPAFSHPPLDVRDTPVTGDRLRLREKF